MRFCCVCSLAALDSSWTVPSVGANSVRSLNATRGSRTTTSAAAAWSAGGRGGRAVGDGTAPGASAPRGCTAPTGRAVSWETTAWGSVNQVGLDSILDTACITKTHHPGGSECKSRVCGYRQSCTAGGVCACPQYRCRGRANPVCGNNGRQYQSMCELQRDECLNNTFIGISSLGACSRGAAWQPWNACTVLQCGFHCCSPGSPSWLLQ